VSSGVVHTPAHTVHLVENKVVPVECAGGVWVLDTCASNHMTGCREALAHLDEGVCGTVCFGDGFSVEIHGVGSMVIQGR